VQPYRRRTVLQRQQIQEDRFKKKKK